jgi:hypothetical protein
MALVTSSSRSLPAAPGGTLRASTGDAAPAEQPPAARAAAPAAGTQRERVRMELLLARARAARG